MSDISNNNIGIGNKDLNTPFKNPAKMSIHSGHRKRVREKLLKYGLESFTEIEVLEMLLFYAIPQGDTNETAHKLLKRFGSLKNVIDAEFEDLKDIAGIGDVSASFIIFTREILKYLNNKRFDNISLSTSRKAGEFCSNYFKLYSEECFIVISLTLDKRLKRIDVISKGSESETSVHRNEIYKAIMRSGARKIMLAHNHPGVSPEPSSEDIVITSTLANNLQELGVEIVDHIVCSENDYISMSDRGVI